MTSGHVAAGTEALPAGKAKDTRAACREGLGWEGRRRRDLGWDKGDIRGHVKDVGFGGP